MAEDNEMNATNTVDSQNKNSSLLVYRKVFLMPQKVTKYIKANGMEKVFHSDGFKGKFYRLCK